MGFFDVVLVAHNHNNLVEALVVDILVEDIVVVAPVDIVVEALVVEPVDIVVVEQAEVVVEALVEALELVVELVAFVELDVELVEALVVVAHQLEYRRQDKSEHLELIPNDNLGIHLLEPIDHHILGRIGTYHQI